MHVNEALFLSESLGSRRVILLAYGHGWSGGGDGWLEGLNDYVDHVLYFLVFSYHGPMLTRERLSLPELVNS